MLIQISESRWVSEPEAVFRKEVVKFVDAPPPDDVVEGEQWVARMPSGTLEWLSDDEYTKLLVGIKVIHGFSPEFQWGTPA